MVRPGAINNCLECWHLDIFDFIDLRKKHGDERRRAQDLFLSVSIPSLFIERLKKNGDWTLFDPYDVPNLTETFGDEFNKLYEQYENEFHSGVRNFNPNTKTIKVAELISKIVFSWSTEGMPFIFFKDNVNKTHPYYKEAGIIRSSNLCMEVVQPVDETETVVCNLGSLVIPNLENEEDIKDTIHVAMRFLDSTIDVSNYATDKARKTQNSRRSCGLGIIGEAEYLAVNHIEYGSDQHKEWIKYFYSLLQKESESYSRQLAQELGGCDLDPTIRNAYRLAIAPNTGTGLLAGSTPSHEPIFGRLVVEKSKVGDYKLIAPKLNIDNIKYYKNAFEVDMFKQVELTALRQKYIDMAISHNIHVEDISKHKATDIIKLLVRGHDLGVKTFYYFRTKAAKVMEGQIENNKKIVCEGCEN